MPRVVITQPPAKARKTLVKSRPKPQSSLTQKLKDAVRAEQQGYETLRCEYGHDFTRTKIRGRKPTLCLEHRPKVAQKPPKPRTANSGPDTTVALREAAEKRREAKNRSDQERIQAVLDNPSVNDELKRKLDYAQKRIDGRIPSDEPIYAMECVRKDCLREVERARSLDV